MAFSLLKTYLYIICLLVVACTFTGCTSFFFLQPTRETYPFAMRDGLAVSELEIQSSDGTRLAAWLLPARENQMKRPDLTRAPLPSGQHAHALVLQFHGNGENMTSHFRFLEWLPFNGYDLLTYDGRGYGRSQGVASVAGELRDALAAIRFAGRLAHERGIPLFFYGQSLGGSLLLKALQIEPAPTELCAIIIESSFYGYRAIAREKLQSTWLTAAFAWLTWPLISDRASPGGPGLKNLPRLPLIFIYSASDPVVPLSHGVRLFADANEPKYFWEHPWPGHVNGMFAGGGALRTRLLLFMETSISKKVSAAL